MQATRAPLINHRLLTVQRQLVVVVVVSSSTLVLQVVPDYEYAFFRLGSLRLPVDKPIADASLGAGICQDVLPSHLGTHQSCTAAFVIAGNYYVCDSMSRAWGRFHFPRSYICDSFQIQQPKTLPCTRSLPSPSVQCWLPLLRSRGLSRVPQGQSARIFASMTGTKDNAILRHWPRDISSQTSIGLPVGELNTTR